MFSFPELPAPLFWYLSHLRSKVLLNVSGATQTSYGPNTSGPFVPPDMKPWLCCSQEHSRLGLQSTQGPSLVRLALSSF